MTLLVARALPRAPRLAPVLARLERAGALVHGPKRRPDLLRSWTGRWRHVPGRVGLGGVLVGGSVGAAFPP